MLDVRVTISWGQDKWNVLGGPLHCSVSVRDYKQRIVSASSFPPLEVMAGILLFIVGTVYMPPVVLLKENRLPLLSILTPYIWV